jgi:SAM-dependent methyltransferase
MKVKDHYDKHLGNFYSWMVGDFAQKQIEQEAFFRKHNIESSLTNVAFDLGAGHGLQTVSLANLGFKVKAVDFNRQLLNELAANTKSMSVEVINSDILQFLEVEKSTADVIVCMGDTLTHLQSRDDVERFVQLASKHLSANGKLIISFRDLTTTLDGEQRFIPVKQDQQKILTCFLEYFSDYVTVHDILYENINDVWVQKISAYTKLRLSVNTIKEMLTKNQFNVLHEETINHMVHLIVRKTSR